MASQVDTSNSLNAAYTSTGKGRFENTALKIKSGVEPSRINFLLGALELAAK